MRMYTLLGVTASTLILAGAAQAQQRPVGMTATFIPDAPAAAASEAVALADRAAADLEHAAMMDVAAEDEGVEDEGFSQAELTGYAAAVEQMQPILAAANGAPSPDQMTQLGAIVTAQGLTGEQFNAISAAAAADPVLAARIRVAGAPASEPGSVAASVTDEELGQFASAMASLRPILAAAAGTPSEEQQAQMAGIVTSAGLSGERFNAIGGALAVDARLRARLALAEAQQN
jgi:hypothetical protein